MTDICVVHNAESNLPLQPQTKRLKEQGKYSQVVVNAFVKQ